MDYFQMAYNRIVVVVLDLYLVLQHAQYICCKRDIINKELLEELEVGGKKEMSVVVVVCGLWFTFH